MGTGGDNGAVGLNCSGCPPHAHEFYGCYLVSMGRLDEGINEGRRAAALDPLSAEISSILGGQDLYFARRYDEAITELYLESYARDERS